MEEEVWLPVVGYEGLYDVSNFGVVRSCSRIVHSSRNYDFNKKSEILSQTTNPFGYLVNYLYKDGIKRSVFAHRSVAIAFIPNPENKRTVNHKDGNKKNNNVNNLEWNTHSENLLHSYREKIRVATNLGRFGKFHNNSKKIRQLSMDGLFICDYDSLSDASRATGAYNGAISASARGYQISAGGFMWSYI